MYSLLASADYGATFWDLMCRGPRKNQQKHLIEQALGPAWEANHVWLFFSIVLLFSGFPEAFGALCVAFAIPLFLILLGIVLRSCTIVIRSCFTDEMRSQLYWGKLFSIPSSMTPLFLGIMIGAISCDSMIMNHDLSENGFTSVWMRPFPLTVSVLALSLFAYLSACYLAVEAGSVDIRNDFRLRALISGAVSIAMASFTYVLAGHSASAVHQGLSGKPAAWIVEACALAATVVAFRGLWFRRFEQARIHAYRSAASKTVVTAANCLTSGPMLL
jgi:cytochrome d ubiquinol oxidase subunit II